MNTSPHSQSPGAGSADDAATVGATPRHGHGRAHGHGHGHGDSGEPVDAPTFWEAHYGAKEQVWSGRVNPVLAQVAYDVAPGRALDVGCGEGGDAIWLAERGWDVEAIDISATALARARRAAEAAGLGDRVRASRYDLEHDLPEGTYDLVSAQFFQSPLDFPRSRILRDLADRLASGGALLVVDHGSAPSWAGHAETEFPTLAAMLEELGLDPERFDIERADSPTRVVTSPDGEQAEIVDHVVLARRRPAAPLL